MFAAAGIDVWSALFLVDLLCVLETEGWVTVTSYIRDIRQHGRVYVVARTVGLVATLGGYVQLFLLTSVTLAFLSRWPDSGVAILVANIFVFVFIDSLLRFAFWSLPKTILGAEFLMG